MARTVLNNRYSQVVNVSVTEAKTGKSLGSANAYRDPRTGITKFQWLCNTVGIEDFNFRTLGSAGYEPADEFFSEVNFYVGDLVISSTAIGGQPFYPKVLLRNSKGISCGGVLFGAAGYLQLCILSNDTKKPTEMFYSIFIEAVFS